MTRFDLSEFLRRRRESIVDEWVRRLSTEVGDQYAQRPLEELYETVEGAFDANYEVLVHGRYGPIHEFINRITIMRLETGFPLSHVQMAFELYRITVVPMLAVEAGPEVFLDCVQRINDCLAVTIHRFSDYFQEMHQRRNLDYARRLEVEVRERTAELQESESRYKTLVEEINDGYFVIQGGAIVFANNAFCKMHQSDPERVLGRQFADFVAPESRKKVLDVYHDSLAGRPTPRALEYLRLTSDGKSIHTELTAKVTRYQDVRSNIGLCRDISERVRMERRMREAERMADVGRITTSLSHEIRNPLSAVQLNLQILKKNRDITGNDARRLDIAVREVGRLEGILKELLDFAKPLPLRLTPCRFEAVMETCLELLEPKFQEYRLGLQLELEENLPRIMADGEKIGQAVMNLLLNAIDVSPEGGRIELSCRRNTLYGQSGIEASVADNGPGVHRDHMREVFKPFFTTKTKGTGLGLTNVKRIVEAHRGRVHARNLEPCGARFRIWLPLGED